MGLTFKERLHNALGAQQIEILKVYHAYVHSVSYEREEFDKIWFKGENSTWVHNFGSMTGFEMIYYNHTMGEGRMGVMDTYEKALTDYFPSFRGGDLRATGASGVHGLSDCCIEMAKDGKSGRLWAITAGVMMDTIGHTKERGKEGPYEKFGAASWEYYGADFVYVDGEWKYIHETVVPVFANSYDGENMGHDLYVRSDDDPSHTQWRGIPCKVGIEGPFNERYDVHQVVQHLLQECPEPYETLDDEHSYVPGKNELK